MIAPERGLFDDLSRDPLRPVRLVRFVTKQATWRDTIGVKGWSKRARGERHSFGQITSLVKPTLASGVASTLTWRDAIAPNIVLTRDSNPSH